MRLVIAAATAAIALSAVPASAATFYAFGFSNFATHSLTVNGTSTVTTTNAGWFNSSGFHSGGNQNYITGTIGSSDFRNFFVFASSGGATSLTLNIATPATWAFDGNPSLTYLLHDASGTINSFANYSGATGVFADLGTGALYGAKTYTSQPGVVSIVLNAAAVNAYNAASDGGQNFGIGGMLSTAAVPEPASWVMLIAGFGLVGAASRRRRASAIVAG